MERMVTDQQVRKVAADIAYVRSAIRRNMSIMREIGVPPTLALSGLLFGSVLTVLFPVMYILIRSYGSHDAIPLWMRAVWYGFAITLAISAGISKQVGLYRSAKAIDRSYSQWTIAREFIFTSSVSSMILTVTGILAAVIVFLVHIGQPLYIVPATAILFGILMSFFGGNTFVPEYYILGYWFSGAGIAAMFFRLPPLISIAFVFGVGFLLFAFAAMIRRNGDVDANRRMRRKDSR
ncbi:MAG: hypothetical protein AABZ39_00565 [Spirochaetota bacterium]